MAKTSIIGSWAFLIGLIIAVIFSFMDINATWATVLVVIGLLVGLFNIADKEVTPFLMSGTVLVIVSSLGADSVGSIGFLGNLLGNLLLVFVPATIIVAIKNVFTLARN